MILSLKVKDGGESERAFVRVCGRERAHMGRSEESDALALGGRTVTAVVPRCTHTLLCF